MNVERERNRLRYVLCLFSVCALLCWGEVDGVRGMGFKMRMVMVVGKDGLLIGI